TADLLCKIDRVVVFHAGDHDLFVLGLIGLFLAGHQFLVNLLPGPQSGDPDIDVLRVTQTAQLDHPDREVVDPDQLSDVEDEDFAALAHRAGEQDQLAGFRNGHKISRDLPVGDRHRSALFDLFFESGDDRAIGAEDVAKPGHDKPGGVQVVQVGHVKFSHA